MAYVWDWSAHNPGMAATRPALDAPAPGPNPNEPGSKFPNTPEGWAEYKQIKRAYLSQISQMDAYVDQNLMLGASLEDLGVLNQKEHGQARWNKYMNLYSTYGRVDPSYEYDWASGQKINRATSHPNPQWQPITEQEKAERKTQQGWGTQQGSYVTRLQNQGQGWIKSAFQGNPAFTKTDNGLWHDTSPGGNYYDPYGAVTDAQGNRIGGAYGFNNTWAQNWPGKQTTPWGRQVLPGGTSATQAGVTGGSPPPTGPNPYGAAMNLSFRPDPMKDPKAVSGMSYQTGPLQQNPTPLTNTPAPGGLQKPLPTYQERRSRVNPYRRSGSPWR